MILKTVTIHRGGHMKISDLIRLLNRLGGQNARLKGNRLYREGFVNKVEAEVDYDEDEFRIYGEVKSERGRRNYNTEIFIDILEKEVVHTDCDCIDFYNNMYKNQCYGCKHIMATFEKFINQVYKNEGIIPSKKTDDTDYGSYLLSYLDMIDNKRKQRANLEVTLKVIETSSTSYNEVEFKIGTKRLYVMKNIREFISACRIGSSINYGKEFEFSIKNYDFSKEDAELIRFIEAQLDIDDMLHPTQYFRNTSSLVSGKILKITAKNLRGFLKCIKNKQINLQYDYSSYKNVNIIEGDIPLSFNIYEDKEGNINLKNNGELPIPLNKFGDVFLYNNQIYLPREEQYRKFPPIYNGFLQNEEIKFKKEMTKEVIEKIIPIINEIGRENKIEKTIKDKMITAPLVAKFYLDKKKRTVTLIFKALYGEIEFDFIKGYEGEQYILRQEEKEQNILNNIRELGFEVIGGEFVFTGSEEKYFELLSEGIKKLREMGEVFYSDRFKKTTIYNSKSIKAAISKDKKDYLEFSFQIGDIDGKEIKNILNAFREKRKFFKLKNDSLIDLSEKEMQDFLKILDNIAEDNKLSSNKVQLNNNKAMYLNSVIDDNNLRFIEGKDIVKDISDKVKNIEALDFTVPINLNATLREYQKVGYKWFKTLAYYGFGGILADEMGLGKTLQTITFLLSEEGKKSLIVAPTSLIYNWKSEFEKFAPSMQVLVLHGNKDDREKLMGDIHNHDVVLTTYNLLRNDLDFYCKKSFDYIVIDEAQNIKNPLSQNAEAIKSINGKVKFALTGTPIENSLMELWSIFDFIMPGYLFNRNKFSSNFIKNFGDEETLNELNRLIKPFILRRYKKDVMTELPDKIEKRLIIDMTDEQKKVYKIFAEEAKNNLEELKEDGLNKKTIEVFSYLTKLRQLCLDPSILLENYKGGSGKLEALLETVIQGIEEERKILVFSQFTSVLGNIAEHLNKEGINYFYLDGSTKAKERLEMVNEFNQGDTKVFLISLKAGGTGLNLTSADIVIHFDPWWNPAVEDQATDRAHRFGQKNVVEVIKLISRGTIEEKILKLQDDKKEVIEKVMSGEFKKGSILNELSEKEILDLFS